MNLKINGKDYKLHFGVAFVHELDTRHKMIQSGLQFGQGLATVTAMLAMGNPAILVDLIQAATITETFPPAKIEIERYIDSVEDMEALINNFLELLETSPTTKLMMKKLAENSKKKTGKEEIKNQKK
jgi:Phage protein.